MKEKLAPQTLVTVIETLLASILKSGGKALAFNANNFLILVK
jgi:hypothetical protein